VTVLLADVSTLKATRHTTSSLYKNSAR